MADTFLDTVLCTRSFWDTQYLHIWYGRIQIDRSFLLASPLTMNYWKWTPKLQVNEDETIEALYRSVIRVLLMK